MLTIFSKNPMLFCSEEVTITFLKKEDVPMLPLPLYFSFVTNFHYIFSVLKQRQRHRAVHRKLRKWYGPISGP